MDQRTYGLMNDAVRVIAELTELLEDHPRQDIVQRAEIIKDACARAAMEALQARISART